MASWLRRVEQGFLQQLGAVSSSYESNTQYNRDEERLERLDKLSSGLSSSLTGHLASLRRVADSAVEYAQSLERVLTAFSSAGSTGGAEITAARFDFRPIIRAQQAAKSSVFAAVERTSSGLLDRVGYITRATAALRQDFAARKELVIDNDSYVRRVSQAEAAVQAAGRDLAALQEARENLRRLQGKLRDSNAMLAQATDRIRARLGELEVQLQSCTTDAGLHLVAAQAHTAQHIADAASGLLPQYPGSVTQLVELSGATAHLAVVNTTLEVFNGADGGSGAPAASSTAQRLPATSLAAATRLPVSLAGVTSSFESLHKTLAPTDGGTSSKPGSRRGSGAGGAGTPAGLVRPPSHAAAPVVTPSAAAAAAAMASAAAALAGDDAGSDADSIPDRSAYQEGSTPVSAPSTAAATPVTAAALPPAASSTAPVSYAMAVYDFEPEQADELGMRTGDILKVVKKEQDGWWWCEGAGGKQGLVPGNRTRELSAAEAAAVRKQSSGKSAGGIRPAVAATVARPAAPPAPAASFGGGWFETPAAAPAAAWVDPFAAAADPFDDPFAAAAPAKPAASSTPASKPSTNSSWAADLSPF